ncbi:I78 family peptidase inhibitor [Acinetobacter towneri]|uniref:Hemolysin n=1 Tax=Acinetobacter towneri TaxID=202956 RepID=A0A1E8DYU9_9GAMM|nr:I78 family peptidase inhibitor [Acinetobacter towneri]OFE42560.1 hemolysin [Acinetobacter towneri]
MKKLYSILTVLSVVTLAACSNQPVNEQTKVPQTMQNCVPESAAQLVGKTGLSETQIKTITRAEIVRMVAPGQPVTMDYRMNRVTVVVDPKTKIILQASCG